MQQNLNMDLFAIGRSSFRKCGWFLSITLDRSLPIGLDYSLLLSLKAVNNTIVTKIDHSYLVANISILSCRV